jgi:hypothetical protein
MSDLKFFKNIPIPLFIDSIIVGSFSYITNNLLLRDLKHFLPNYISPLFFLQFNSEILNLLKHSTNLKVNDENHFEVNYKAMINLGQHLMIFSGFDNFFRKYEQ